MKVKEKVFVVTGGGNGIGRELTLALLNSEARVAAVDIDETGLQETVELAGQSKDRLSTHKINITDKGQVAALPDQIIAEHGAIDAVINNAGIIQPFVLVNDIDYEDIQRVMDVNFYGTLYMTKAFLPHLLDRPQAHLVNVSSMGGFLPVPGQSIYGASKAAVKLLTEALHSELTETNVSVTIAFPGATNTNISSNSGLEGSRSAQQENGASSFNPMDPAEVAQQIITGIEKDRYRVLIGSDTRFMNLLYRLAPKFAANYIYSQMKSLLPR